MTGEIVHQHFAAKSFGSATVLNCSTTTSFSVFDYVLSIMKENSVYRAHIVAARATKITEHVVFDSNRGAVFLRKTLAQLLRPKCRIAVTPVHISVEHKWRRTIFPFGTNFYPMAPSHPTPRSSEKFSPSLCW